MSKALKIVACVALLAAWLGIFFTTAAQHRRESESLARRNMDLREEADTLRQKHAALVLENQAQREQIADLQAQSAALEGTVGAPNESAEHIPPSPKADQQLQRLTTQIALKDRTIEDLRAEIARLKDLLARAREDESPEKVKLLLVQQARVRKELQDLAELMLDTAQYGSAQRLLECAVELGGGSLRVLFTLGYCCGELNDDAAAARWYERAAKAAQDRPTLRAELLPKLYSNYGATLVRLGRPGDALAWYEKAVEADQDYAPVHFNLGRLYAEHLGKPGKAVGSYRRHIALGGRRTISAQNAILKLLDENPEIESPAEPDADR